VILPTDMLEEIAVDEISNLTRVLIMTVWTPDREATSRYLLAEMRKQEPRRDATFRAVVDEFAATVEEWSRPNRRPDPVFLYPEPK
jgi:hypothetical protein